MCNIKAMENTGSIEIDLTCELCSKSYQRRDLLQRHRRRCKGPPKPMARRKACNACVQAKSKCCCTQPRCTRCTFRGIQCVYVAASPASSSSEQTHAMESPLQISPSTNIERFITSAELFDLELPAWDFPISSSYSLGNFDMNMTDLASSSETLQGFTTSNPSLLQSRIELAQSSQPLPQSPTSTDISASTSLILVRILSEYPYLLMKGSFLCPFLHLELYSLYSNVVPDMTFLPQTSMAICCSTGINIPDINRFFKRAIEAARQRLIGSFPGFECMQKWDALHAMLIYDISELRESIREESEDWKHNPKVKGLGSPFLLKMTQGYLQSYPEIFNPDINIFSKPKSSPCTQATTTWARWRITETARRTIFFASIVMFYSNRDYSIGKQMSFYEPMNEELILNMPLPCSEAAWSARNEDDWRLAIEKEESMKNQISVGMNEDGRGRLAVEINLKSIFTKYSKEYIQAEIGDRVGFGSSEELRGFIILCASVQFA